MTTFKQYYLPNKLIPDLSAWFYGTFISQCCLYDPGCRGGGRKGEGEGERGGIREKKGRWETKREEERRRGKKGGGRKQKRGGKTRPPVPHLLCVVESGRELNAQFHSAASLSYHARILFTQHNTSPSHIIPIWGSTHPP